MSCLRYCASGSSASREAPKHDMSNDSTANILIVDDDVKSLLAMEALLAAPGREIVTAKSGAEALRCLLRRDFSLILLDVRIPHMDGFGTGTLIPHRQPSPSTPIIFYFSIHTSTA